MNKHSNLGQSKKMTFCESMFNVFCGMFVAFSISQLAFLYQGVIREVLWSGFVWNIGTGSNVAMTIILTLISIARGYIFRRIFNKLHQKHIHMTLKGMKHE